MLVVVHPKEKQTAEQCTPRLQVAMPEAGRFTRNKASNAAATATLPALAGLHPIWLIGPLQVHRLIIPLVDVVSLPATAAARSTRRPSRNAAGRTGQ